MVYSLNIQVLEERVLDCDARLAILGAISIASPGAVMASAAMRVGEKLRRHNDYLALFPKEHFVQHISDRDCPSHHQI